jgi:hypothetical protein
MTNKKYEVLFMDENVWTVDGKPDIFNSLAEAEKELAAHFDDMIDADMDFEPTDYRIEEIKND